MNNFAGALIALFVSVSSAFQPITSETEVEPPNPQAIQLASFLESKRSPMPADILIQYPNWKIIVALSNAESSYGRFMAGDYNAWGIKDFRKGSLRFGQTRSFTSWEESIRYTSELLYKYDPEDGLPDPNRMVARWKYVQPYAHWIRNVSYSLHEINQQVILPTAEEELI